jgi:hypothetical protein
MREKLIELIEQAYFCNIESLADHLIANGVTIQKWIPVTERLPEEDVRVLVWVGANSCNFPVIDTDRIHNGRWVRWDEYITHWMPLPEPPKGETNEN